MEEKKTINENKVQNDSTLYVKDIILELNKINENLKIFNKNYYPMIKYNGYYYYLGDLTFYGQAYNPTTFHKEYYEYKLVEGNSLNYNLLEHATTDDVFKKFKIKLSKVVFGYEFKYDTLDKNLFQFVNINDDGNEKEIYKQFVNTIKYMLFDKYAIFKKETLDRISEDYELQNITTSVLKKIDILNLEENGFIFDQKCQNINEYEYRDDKENNLFLIKKYSDDKFMYIIVKK